MAQSHTNNCFVVSRPADRTGEISVKTWDQVHALDEKEKFYRNSFERYFLNIDGKLSPAKHKLCLALLLPLFAVLSFHEMSIQELELRKDFEAKATPNQLDEYNGFPDNESMTHYILNLKLMEFRSDLKENGLEFAIEQNPVLFHVIEKIYLFLPLCCITGMIETVNSLNC